MARQLESSSLFFSIAALSTYHFKSQNTNWWIFDTFFSYSFFQEPDLSCVRYAEKDFAKHLHYAVTKSSTLQKNLINVGPAAKPSTGAQLSTLTCEFTWGTSHLYANSVEKASTKKATTKITDWPIRVRRHSSATFATKLFTRWLGEDFFQN